MSPVSKLPPQHQLVLVDLLGSPPTVGSSDRKPNLKGKKRYTPFLSLCPDVVYFLQWKTTPLLKKKTVSTDCTVIKDSRDYVYSLYFRDFPKSS